MFLKMLVATRAATYNENAHGLTAEGTNEAHALADLLRPFLRGNPQENTMVLFSTPEHEDEERFAATIQTAQILAAEFGVPPEHIQQLPSSVHDKPLATFRHIRFVTDQCDFETVILVTSSKRASAFIERSFQHVTLNPVEADISPPKSEAIVLDFSHRPMKVSTLSCTPES